jgi:hypothetical protein
MDEYLDTYLRKLVKHWAGRQQPPAQVRSRVLWLAAYPPKRGNKRDHRPVLPLEHYKPVSWEHFLLTYDIVHSFQNGLSVSRILV